MISLIDSEAYAKKKKFFFFFINYYTAMACLRRSRMRRISESIAATRALNLMSKSARSKSGVL